MAAADRVVLASPIRFKKRAEEAASTLGEIPFEVATLIANSLPAKRAYWFLVMHCKRSYVIDLASAQESIAKSSYWWGRIRRSITEEISPIQEKVKSGEYPSPAHYYFARAREYFHQPNILTGEGPIDDPPVHFFDAGDAAFDGSSPQHNFPIRAGLLRAIAANHERAVAELLLLSNTYLRPNENSDATPLQHPSYLGDRTCGPTILRWAAQQGHIERVQDLLSKGHEDPFGVDKEGHTALQLARAAGHKEIEQALVQYELNYRLFEICSYQMMDRSLDLFFGRLQDLHAPLDPRFTPLQVEFHRLLVENSDDLGIVDGQLQIGEVHWRAGRRPILEARYREYLIRTLDFVSMIQDLAKQGADLNATDHTGKTPLQLVYRSYRSLFTSKEKHLAALEILLALGADPNPLFHKVCQSTYPHQADLTRLMLSRGAEVNRKNCAGPTPLNSALSGRELNVETVRLLIEAGADVKAADSKWMDIFLEVQTTPLIELLRSRFHDDPAAKEIERLLLEAGATPVKETVLKEKETAFVVDLRGDEVLFPEDYVPISFEEEFDMEAEDTPLISLPPKPPSLWDWEGPPTIGWCWRPPEKRASSPRASSSSAAASSSSAS